MPSAGWQEHWPPAVFGRAAPQALTWSAAEAPLPADAAQTSSQSAALDDVACPGAQSCVAVGYYATSNSGGGNGSTHGLIETFSHGTWTPAAAPVDVAGTSQATFVYFSGVACPAQGACVAVGSYYDSQNIEIPLTDTLSGGTWTSAKPALPGDAAQGKSAFLSEIACPAPGTCVATGWYTDTSGDAQGLIDTLSGGTWTAQRAPLPAGAIPSKPSSSKLPTALFLVKCPAVGSCVATGDYIDQSGGTQGLIDTLSGGTWTAQRAPLPGDAAANPVALVWALACPAPGACLAGGHYNSSNGQSRGLIENSVGWHLDPGGRSVARGRRGQPEMEPGPGDGPDRGRVRGARDLRGRGLLHRAERRHRGRARHAVGWHLDGSGGPPSRRRGRGQAVRLFRLGRVPGRRRLHSHWRLQDPGRQHPGPHRDRRTSRADVSGRGRAGMIGVAHDPIRR